MIYIIIIIMSIIVVQNKAARILAVFPTPSWSHQSVFRSLTQEIAKRGHEVTFISPIPGFTKGSAPKNLIEIDVSNETMPTWAEKRKNTKIGPPYYNTIENTLNLITMIFERQLKNPEVRNIIESGQKYDLLLLEGWLRVPLVFSRLFNAPIIRVNSLAASLNNDYSFGVPKHPVIFPRNYQYKTYNLTSWDIVWQFKHSFFVDRMLKATADREDSMFRSVFGKEFPTVDEFDGNNHMLFVSIHRYWDGNYPMPMSIVNIGGIHLKQAKQLPEDLKSYLDASPRGVIYVSFGTYTTSSKLPKRLVSAFMKVFTDIPYNVLWRWDVDELPGRADNIKFMKWVPQADLLSHPNIKLFITQAGMQSTEEAISACVPVIGIPLAVDQWFNAESYVKHNIGVKLEMDEINEKNLRESIDLLVKDDTYRQRVCKLRDIVNDLPQTSVERMAWWVEYVLKHHGSGHLRSPTANLPTYIHYELELLALIITCFLSVGCVVYLTLCYIARFVLKKISTLY